MLAVDLRHDCIIDLSTIVDLLDTSETLTWGPGSACRSSCWAWISSRPSGGPPRQGLSAWTPHWCPPTWCTRRCSSRSTTPAETAIAGSGQSLENIASETIKTLRSIQQHINEVKSFINRENTWFLLIINSRVTSCYVFDENGLYYKRSKNTI